PQSEPEPAVDAPDWLSEAAPVAEDEFQQDAVITDEPDWLTEAAPVAEAEPEAEVSSPDWLSAMSFDEPQSEPEPAVDAPDWLSEAAPVAEDEPQQDAVITDEPDWLRDLEAPAQAQPEPTLEAGVPEWLSEEPELTEPPEADTVTAIPDQIRNWAATVRSEASMTPQLDDDTPDWLAAMQPEPEPEDDYALASDEPDWLAAADTSIESAVPITEPEWSTEVEQPTAVTEEPDWLTSEQPTAESEFDDEQLAAADSPDWLAAAQLDLEPESTPAAVVSDDTPDWLRDVQPEAEAAPEVEPVADSAPDWLSSLEPLDETDEPEPAAADEPDWITDIVPADIEEEPHTTAEWLSDPELDAPPPQPERNFVPPGNFGATRDLSDYTGGSAHDDDRDWLPKTDDDLISRVTSDAPQWLDEVQMDAVPEPDQSYSEFSETDENGDMPDWIQAMKPAPAEPEYAEPEISIEDALPGTPAPAENAPDWLNAMVPGLDVDYDAPEDEQIEKDFIAGHENRITPGSKASTAESRPRPEFSWLTDIVDEESQQIRTVGERSRRRFVFSRLPAWLRQPTEKRDQPQSGDESNDVDIPPWLK
ncbi:MAG: hypothetical protein JNJ78_20650, partial [Anaerolineae bacterium]|nr:hypothetical protein [Anaerolineae bacterium]